MTEIDEVVENIYQKHRGVIGDQLSMKGCEVVITKYFPEETHPRLETMTLALFRRINKDQ